IGVNFTMTLDPSSMSSGVISSSLSSFQIGVKSFSRSTLLTSFIADSSTGHLKSAWSCGGPYLTLCLMFSIASWPTFKVRECDKALAFRNADTTSPPGHFKAARCHQQCKMEQKMGKRDRVSSPTRLSQKERCEVAAEWETLCGS